MSPEKMQEININLRLKWQYNNGISSTNKLVRKDTKLTK